MASYNDVLVNYRTIKNTFEQLRIYLIKQLKKCYLTGIDDYNFTELIEAIEEIECREYYNSNNIKPLVKPQINNSNLSKYNETLYLRIRYYMRFIAYFLVLNGVSNDEVAKQTTLLGLISLLDQMDVKIPTTLNVQLIQQNYYFGSEIILDYSLFDINNDNIYEGDIEIRSGDIIYDYIKAGEPLKFTPIEISEKQNGVYQPTTFTFTYLGTDKYQSSTSINREIIILPAKIKLDISATNITTQSKYYNNTNIGYNTDTWKIDINTYNFKGEILPEIPVTIYIGDDVIEEVTDINGRCSIEYSIAERGIHTLIFVTNYENTDLMTNVEEEYEITIYYNPLYQEYKDYVDYAGKSQYTYEVIIKNEDTGENSSHLNGRTIDLLLDEEQIDNVVITNGKATLNTNYLEEGEHVLRWIIDNNQITTNIKILSNFILPNKNKFFLPETPDIIYAPLNTELYNTNNWIPLQSQHATGIISYEIEDINTETLDLYTNNQGVLHAIKEYQYPTQYALELTSASNNLNETKTYEYEIVQPFVLILDEYDRTEYALYKIDIYDKDNYSLGDYINCLAFDRNIINLCTISENIFDEYYEISVLIPTNTQTTGKNTITFTLNNYTQNDTFKLYNKTFELLTDTVIVGNHDIQIQCYDNEIEDIVIDNEYIIVNEITKQNDIFIINADFIQNGNINFTINNDDEDENFTITVSKATIDAEIIIEETIPSGGTYISYDEDTGESEEIIADLHQEVSEFEYININNIQVYFNIETPLYDDITIIYSIDNNEVETYSTSAEDKVLTIPSSFTPGQHTMTFSYYANSNSNYNSFSFSKTFTILKSTPTYKLINQRPGYIR